ncbi:MAG: GTP-binding protein, partial [Nitrospinota bacterium]
MPEELPGVETSFHVVIVGHVDHGKSTLIGRLLYDTNSLSTDRLEEIKRISADMGKEMEFAYVMDHLQEERERNITIDIAYTFFKTPKRRYVIIDAPGHKEFLKNMISGSSQAHGALLLVDASRGVEEQTRRHSFLLSLLGVKQIAVLVNKMDLLEWSREEFGKIRDSLLPVLERLEIFPEYIVPISAKLGANVADSCEELSWFDGPTVLETLDGFRAAQTQEKSLRFPIQDIYDANGSALAV